MGAEFDNLHQVLRSLYTEMMPMCGDMIGVAKGIAGLGALFYVALRVWQTLARAEPIDVYPLLRPFALGLCILFFPMVLDTINGVLSPVVQGTHKMLEKQTFSMDEYRKLRDKLEYEAMVKNPETAYLVSNEEFDKKLDELGISPSDMATMAGMYVERGMYNLKIDSQYGAGALGTAFRRCRPTHRHASDILSDCPLHLGTDSLCHLRVGRFSEYPHAMVHEVYLHLSVATCSGLVQFDAGKDSGTDAQTRHHAVTE